MVVVGENGCQSGLLTAAQQREPGAQGAPHPVERIAGAAAVTAGLLLDALAAQVELGAGQRDDVERIHHRGRLGQLLGRGGLVAAESVHGHDLDLVAKLR